MALTFLPRPLRRHRLTYPGRRVGGKTYAAWPRSRPVCWLRQALTAGLLLPALRLAYRIEVLGAEHFGLTSAPCLIISNHNMHLDWAILMASMPSRVRRRLLVAAAATDICGNPVRRLGVEVLGNAFPFDKEGSGIRDSLEFITRRLQERWNVLLFPEGKLTVVGPMAPFKQGIGWLAAHSSAEVIPIRIDVIRPGGYEGKWWPHPRGRVRVSVGEPVRRNEDETYADFVARLEQCVIEA